MAEKLKILILGAFKLSKQLVRRQLIPLLILIIAGSLLTLQIEDSVQGLSPDQEGQRWIYQLSLGLWDLFEGIMIFLVLSWGVAKIRDFKSANFEPQPFRRGYVGSFLAEYLRMLAQILLYFLLLIVPAIIRYCRLIFVPYVALFSKHYQAGQVDAVQFSLELTRKYFWLILGFFIATTALQVAIEFLPNLVPDLHTAPIRFLFMMAGSYLSIWSYSFVYLLFEEALKEKTWT